ncbi:lipopolysaccharide heptosyltransferase I [Crenobacter cavernae]|uniref:Lipopolysaccharide heptosyltransferase 1 n=1 Tax=Crenobacter cavernae TaxID=2290923 RepID=A0A345Y4V0_9NEIS|nr:lipopolysaccharide heptosyltransferase I [Crenobacter cavernae]AXK38952.1 lipopolysaccharide heptosyltransferase I [Crenobacter cavernae]
MNILIVRTSSMGDLIHTYPALTDFARHFPDARVSWLAEEGFARIAALHPVVDAVIPIAWRRWRKSLLSAATWREIGACKRALSDPRFDLVVDMQGLVKSAIPARWAKSPLAGYDRDSIREPLASRFYDKRYPVSRQLSAVERNRQLLGRVFGYTPQGAPAFGIEAGDRLAWLPKTDYAVLLHATSRDSKEWAEENWVALAKRLAEQKGWISVLPWGNDAEKARAERLAAQIPGAIAAPKLNLTEAAALLGHASAVIGVDTGLTHLANALDVPLVGLYTDTDPSLTGVIESPRAKNLGGPGARPTPDEVWDALIALEGTA